MKRGGWNTRFGFYLAAVGSAFGLGSLWRFPYVVQENGGGAFVILYLVLVFVLGMPLLIGELLLGKSSGSSIQTSFRQLQEQSTGRFQKWLKPILPYTGHLAIFICLLVLAYYSVVSGWVLYFFGNFLVGGVDPQNSESMMAALNENGALQIILAMGHLLIVIGVVAKDVEEGIERWVGHMMPIFVVLLLALTVKALSMTTNREALQFFLYPNIGALNISSLGYAVGHVLFTLSIGFGTMITFGSYLRKSVYIPIAGFRVAFLDSLTAFFAGLLIFPLVMASSLEASGPTLLFETLPSLFTQLPGGVFFGVAFFVCLYLAAFGASIGIFETIVSNIKEELKWSRMKAALVCGGVILALSILPALSSSVFKNVTVNGRSLFASIDVIIINWFVPIVALVVSQIVCYRLNEQVKREEFIHEESPASRKLYSHWIFALKFIVPGVIGLALFLQFLDLVL